MMWIGAMNEFKSTTTKVLTEFRDDVREFRDDIKELRDDIKKIFGRLPPEPVLSDKSKNGGSRSPPTRAG